MHYYTGRVLEIRLEIYKFPSLLIECPSVALPAPGQYWQAHAPSEIHTPLATTLFPKNLPKKERNTLTIEVQPGRLVNWEPGTHLQIRGPLGKGFSMPNSAQRVALVGMDAHPARLLPLLKQALAQDAAVALFCHEPPAGLPASVEVNPLAQYKETLPWADYTAFDIPLSALDGFRQFLDLPPDIPLPTNSQALIAGPMPCGALAECGVCAFKAKRSWKLACKDGPVVNIHDLRI